MPEPDAEPDLSNTVLGRYRLLRRLGAGGMGSVYLAQHELIDRQVALKVLHPSLAQKAGARKRFLREARAASKVKHPGVVEIHDVAFAGEHVYFVMELLAGCDLSDRLVAEGRLPWPQAYPILHQVADALATAHAAGVVHRDIKPSNCFLVAAPDGSERVKVVDFGIAKLAADELAPADRLTATGEVFGTLGYMAPEMGQGAGDDPRSDVYALGVMMFELLTGRLPFMGNSLQVLSQHLTVSPPAPRSLDPSIPPEVERVVLRALEKQPDDRFASMQHFIAALEAVAPGPSPPRRELAASPAIRAAPRPGAVAPTRNLASPAAPPGSRRPAMPAVVTTSDVVDLDRRSDAPRRSSSTADPWQPHATSTASGEEPPPPPMPDEPLPPSRFRPPPEPSLALELPRHPREDDARSRPVPAWRRFMPAFLLIGTLAALAAVVAAIWQDHGAELDVASTSADAPPSADPSASTPAPTPAPVLLHIETTPRSARIYIDDTLVTDRPVTVPRSNEYLRIRVEADGYDPRTTQVQPRVDRRLEVKLDRTKPKKR